MWDHPRVCGEKDPLTVMVAVIWGSPPRMRGKEQRGHEGGRRPGITPAYAGKSTSRCARRRRPRDHPRVCGEKRNRCGRLYRGAGSPPRMRGKVASPRENSAPPGITPAYAGKSGTNSRSRSVSGDHPRVCGEKTSSTIKLLAGGGITPAYAGKSQWPTYRHVHTRDHPRVCGEKLVERNNPNPVMGSPPRMRGKVAEQSKDVVQTGITPAYAGKSRHQHRPADEGRDHPRVCGEKSVVKMKNTLNEGSPPRMRGKGVCLSAGGIHVGITPAYAGKRLRKP